MDGNAQDPDLDAEMALVRYHLAVCAGAIEALQESGAPPHRLMWALAELDQLHAGLDTVVAQRRRPRP